MSIRGEVQNGHRVQVDFPDFEGEAGFQDQGQRVSISYVPNKDGNRLGDGSEIQLLGQTYRIVKGGRSEYVTSMVTLELEAVS